LINVQAEVYFRIRANETEKFLLQAKSVDALIARAVESALAEWIAAHKYDDVFVSGKQLLPGIVRLRLQERLDDYDLGVEIERVDITKLHPPEQVREAFERLATAQNSIETREKEAKQKAARN